MPLQSIEDRTPEVAPPPAPLTAAGRGGGLRAVWPYVQIARADHWFKNAFMLLGTVLAYFYTADAFGREGLIALGWAVVATCLIASSNYVINEVVDAPYDRHHPTKRERPVAAGRVRVGLAIVEWLVLGAIGIGLAFRINPFVGASGLALWVMGVLYNLRPIRTKELPYLDVLSESINNPLRLLLGWFPLIPDRLPPLSLVLAYWMVGAFFMAIKRFAEYRKIGDRETAIRYRRSFRHYTEDRLLVSMFFYVATCALFAGVFIVRYHLELILQVPLAAGFLAYYMKLGLEPDSPVQNPEKLYRVPGFLAFGVLCALVFVGLMFVHIPAIYDLFNVEPVRTDPLWTIGR